MRTEDIKKVTEEGVFVVSNGSDEMRAIIRRDPASGKHLVYFVREATSSEIAEFMKSTDAEGAK